MYLFFLIAGKASSPSTGIFSAESAQGTGRVRGVGVGFHFFFFFLFLSLFMFSRWIWFTFSVVLFVSRCISLSFPPLSFSLFVVFRFCASVRVVRFFVSLHANTPLCCHRLSFSFLFSGALAHDLKDLKIFKSSYLRRDTVGRRFETPSTPPHPPKSGLAPGSGGD